MNNTKIKNVCQAAVKQLTKLELYQLKKVVEQTKKK